MESKQTGQKLTQQKPFSFGIKYKVVKQIKEATVVYLHHITDGHNKFYKIERFIVLNDPGQPWRVVATWGKIGTLGSKTDYRCPDEKTAKDWFNKKVKEKKAKGYVYCDPF
jgi:predicted DNA-binding WGR domain protein